MVAGLLGKLGAQLQLNKTDTQSDGILEREQAREAKANAALARAQTESTILDQMGKCFALLETLKGPHRAIIEKQLTSLERQLGDLVNLRVASRKC